MSDIIPVEYKNKKCVFIGNKYFFFFFKCSINPKPLGLPIYLIIFCYNFVHSFYYIHKFIYDNIIYLIILIIFTLLFTLQIIQTLVTTLIDPGSFLPNKKEDNSNSSEAKLMIATIKEQDYFLKFWWVNFVGFGFYDLFVCYLLFFLIKINWKILKKLDKIFSAIYNGNKNKGEERKF